jgi:hypothetical protein
MEHEHEEVEQIPWPMLAEQLDEGRRRSIATIALAAVAALVAGLVAVNVLRRPSGTTVDLVPATTEVVAEAVEEQAPDGEPAGVAEPTPADVDTAIVQPAPTLYSEADLMAVLPEGDQLLVAARAEWFIADFFTVLGPDDAVAGLPSGLPRPVAEEGGYSWVEWVRAARVVPVSADQFEVTVLFRTLRRDLDGALVRSPIAAVVVPVSLDLEGALGIGGLPRPADLPQEAAALPRPPLTMPPDDVAAVAVAAVAGFGEAPAVEGGVLGAVGWRVVITVTGEAGVRWPLEVDVTAPPVDG